MDNVETNAIADQNTTSDTGKVFTHAHSFALRQGIINQLNSCQKTEHDSINTVRQISLSNTEQVLAILTHWLCFDFSQASQDEIEAINLISDQRHKDWQALVAKKTDLEASLHVTNEELGKAEKYYAEIGGLIGTKEWLAKGEEKTKIQEANARVKALKSRKDELNKGITDTRAGMDSFVDRFLQNCCNNLEKMPNTTPLGRKLHNVIEETKKKLSDELYRHCQDQHKQMELIENSFKCLKAMYSLGEQL